MAVNVGEPQESWISNLQPRQQHRVANTAQENSHWDARHRMLLHNSPIGHFKCRCPVSAAGLQSLETLEARPGFVVRAPDPAANF
jgi:hypothetical protein